MEGQDNPDRVVLLEHNAYDFDNVIYTFTSRMNYFAFQDALGSINWAHIFLSMAISGPYIGRVERIA
jgi:hypothetical protein